ncbi:MAG: hypothetical protein ACR2OI_12960 [Acidimicrobiia bacterium]
MRRNLAPIGPRPTLAAALLMVLAACSGSDPSSGDPTTSTSAPATTTTVSRTVPPTTSGVETSTPDTGQDAEPVPTTEMRLAVVGPEEMVFDWTTDRCEDEHIPDIAARAIRDSDGQVHLFVSHYVTYRMSGEHLESVVTDCSAPVMTSAFDSDPSQFDEAEWLAAPFTEDGETVYAVVHNEYRGFVFSRTGLCPSGDHLSCIDVTLTMSISTDGGATFDDIAPPPDHLMATMPYTYQADGVPSGVWQTSNLIDRGDGFYYLMANVSAYPAGPGQEPPQWACLMRTDDLSEPTSWRYWDGDGFNGIFRDPYRSDDDTAETCAPIADPQLSASLTETIVYDEVLERYVAMGMSRHQTDPDAPWGIYYSLSEDLINWTARQSLLELPMSPTVADPDTDLRYAYPAIIDPDSPSLNFATSDGEAYVYIARLNAGGGSLDRDLVRYPIAVETFELEPPDWTFDADGDVEGWDPTNQVDGIKSAGGTLTMTSTGDDPYLHGPAVRFPGGAYQTMVITMSLEAAGPTTPGQVFFITEEDQLFDEAKSVVFNITSDGEMHTYEIDMSSSSGWAGMVALVRLDPGAVAGATISIDSISFR